MYYRNIIIVIKDEDCEKYLREIPNWNYKNDNENANWWYFFLINENENIIISFKKINAYTYKSQNVLPYKTEEHTLREPKSSNIQDDILFKLCKEIMNRFENDIMLCGIIPCKEDYK